MKATIVYNKHKEPRLLIDLETECEREFFKGMPDLRLVRQGEIDGVLTDVSFEACK